MARPRPQEPAGFRLGLKAKMDLKLYLSRMSRTSSWSCSYPTSFDFDTSIGPLPRLNTWISTSGTRVPTLLESLLLSSISPFSFSSVFSIWLMLALTNFDRFVSSCIVSSESREVPLHDMLTISHQILRVDM